VRFFKFDVGSATANQAMVVYAKPDKMEIEAEIVLHIGHLGAMTIATNMAGHETDIIVGGDAEFMPRLKLRKMLMPR
ncbi:hypothetical protein CCACVL1_23624, partial [Corchorus capsularis]